jgi:hypothetical protein
MALSSTIHLHPPVSPSTKTKFLIYHITGNPGLIEYYRTFLTHLYDSLTNPLLTSLSESPLSRLDFHVYGRSLNGFEVDESSSTSLSSSYRNAVKTLPYSLEEQIVQSQQALEEVVQKLTNEGAKDVRVILMGHSVGSYILLEIIRRVRAKGEDVRIVGGICLFPTVMDIAKSESGKIASVCTGHEFIDYLQSIHELVTQILSYPF